MNISNNLNLPNDAGTQKIAMLGRTGSGKSYASGKLVELLLESKQQVVVLDPVGIWWGLRLNKDGKTASEFNLPVLGGLHGDIPLESTSGAMIADLIVDRNISMVLDISQFEYDTDKSRFATAFADRFFFRKKGSPSPVCLVMDEAQEFIPQNTMKGEERMLHAFTRIWKLGRNFGIGGVIISQRPQEINKKALNQTECLFCFQTTGLHERKSIEDWIKDKALSLDIAGDLPKLQKGYAHVWSPQWLQVSEVVKIAQKKTFDSSSTPATTKPVQVKELAPIDLDKLAEQMKTTIEKAKANDPELLKKEVKQLKKDLEKAKDEKEVDEDEIEKRVNAAKLEIHKQYKFFIKERDKRIEEMSQIIANSSSILSTYEYKELSEVEIVIPENILKASTPKNTETLKNARTFDKPAVIEKDAHWREKPEGSTKLKNGAERMLKALVTWHPNFISQTQMRTMAGLKKSGTFTGYMSNLRTGGYIEENGKDVRATQRGLDYFGGEVIESPQSTEDVLAIWHPKLKEGARRMLTVLIQQGGEYISYEQLAEESNLALSGTFTGYLSNLRTANLVLTQNSQAAANKETLFL